MTAKRPSPEAQRRGTAEKAAPPAVTGRYTALSTRWLHSSAVGPHPGQVVTQATAAATKQSGPPKAKAANAAKSSQGSTVARKMAARSGSPSPSGPSKVTKSSAAGKFLSQDAQPKNPYAMSREQVFEVLRKTNVLTSAGRLTKVFK